MDSLIEAYERDLKRVLAFAGSVQTLFPDKTVNWQLDYCKSGVGIVQPLTRQELHKLVRATGVKMFFYPGCHGKRIAANYRTEPQLQVLTLIDCASCSGRKRKGFLKRVLEAVMDTFFRARIYYVFNATTGKMSWFRTPRGVNPDYTQACVEYGNCGCIKNLPTKSCNLVFDSCNCDCPPPLANSSQVSKSCFPTGAWCGSYPSCPCNCLPTCATNSCGYDCNPGYTWDGSKCVSSGAAKELLMDGYYLTER